MDVLDCVAAQALQVGRCNAENAQARERTCFSSLSDSSHFEPKLATFSVSVSFVCGHHNQGISNTLSVAADAS